MINLNDATVTNGKLECVGWEAKLSAPTATVTTGLARILTSTQTIEVPSYAAAGVFSPEGPGVMPAYAFQPCDYGLQTVLDSAPGAVTPTVPPALAEDSNPDNHLNLTAITPTTIDLNSTAVIPLTATGNNKLVDVTHVAFSNPSGVPVHVEVLRTTASRSGSVGTVTLSNIPASIRDDQGIWWVRVSQDGGARWSNALPLRVGEVNLECASAPSAGNFGPLKMFRANEPLSTQARLAENFAFGLDFTLTKYPGGGPPWTCTAGGASVISTAGALRDGTNCVDTDTGNVGAAEDGLLTMTGARLVKPTNSTCGRSNVSLNFGGSIGSRSVNNDTFTCYLDGAVSPASLTAGYSGAPVVSADIVKSPRFFWVPVFGRDATSGGSAMYRIVDFRPAFVTGPVSGTPTGMTGPDADGNYSFNGMVFQRTGSSYKLIKLQVFFFPASAMPESISGGPVMDYVGVGPKVMVLVD